VCSSVKPPSAILNMNLRFGLSVSSTPLTSSLSSFLSSFVHSFFSSYNDKEVIIRQGSHKLSFQTTIFTHCGCADFLCLDGTPTLLQTAVVSYSPHLLTKPLLFWCLNYIPWTIISNIRKRPAFYKNYNSNCYTACWDSATDFDNENAWAGNREGLMRITSICHH
jgi:hypothetical protein